MSPPADSSPPRPGEAVLSPGDCLAVPDEASRWFRDEVLPHESALRSYLRGRCTQQTDVDDVVQESYARLFRARLTGTIAEVRPYLFAIARNAARDCFRRSATRSEEAVSDWNQLPVQAEDSDVAEIVSLNQELTILTEAIRALPARCRAVFTLRKLHGLSQKEIAEKLRMSEHTVERQITLGLHRCRHFLATRGVTADRLRKARQERKSS